MARDLKRRLEKLGRWGPVGAGPCFPGWSLLDQMADVADHVRFHCRSGTVYSATDRELSVLAAASSSERIETLGRGEAAVLPSGASVWVEGKPGAERIAWSGTPDPGADLLEELREHVRRLDPRTQPERERELTRFFRDRPAREAEERRVEEARERHSLTTRIRDAQLLQRNRAAVGLPELPHLAGDLQELRQQWAAKYGSEELPERDA